MKLCLRCAVYNEATTFEVEIEENSNVNALRKTIFDKKRYNHLYQFDASRLTLYLARKVENNEVKWLREDDNLRVLLKGDVDDTYPLMHSWWILNHECFPRNFDPVRNEIQVLVELPDSHQFSLKNSNCIGLHYQMTDMNDRYYFSGGNLRQFLAGTSCAMESVNQADCVSELFHTKYQQTSNSQMDRLRMITTTDNKNDENYLEKYFISTRWVCAITSEYALRQLGKHVQSSYYEKLWCNGRIIGDDALMVIAFENYVDMMARDGKKIELQARVYDGKEQQQQTYFAVNIERKLYINKRMNEQKLSGGDVSYHKYRYLLGAKADEVGLILITNSNAHKINAVTSEKYASDATCTMYVALVPDKATCDNFHLSPANPLSQVPLYVAHIPTWKL